MSGAERDDLVRLLREATDDHPIRPDCLAIADAILAAGWVSPERLTEMARQATAAAAERDALAATIERVRALCDEWAEPTHYPAVALRLRAALDADEARAVEEGQSSALTTTAPGAAADTGEGDA